MHYAFLKAKRYTGQEVRVLQRKLDGQRLMVVVNDGGIVCKTRTDGIDLWPKMYGHLKESMETLPEGTIMDGELFAEGRPSSDVKTLINEQSEELKFWPFAVPFYGGPRQWEWGNPTLDGAIRSHGFSHPETEVLRFPRPVDYDRLAEIARSRGWEGWIAKESHLSGWYKIKPTLTVDCVITGWSQSTAPTTYGMIRGFQVSVRKGGKWVEIANVGTGLSQSFRLQEDGKYDDWIGRVVVVEYDSLASQNRLRFPRFVADSRGYPVIREDKEPLECSFEQLTHGA